MNEIVQSSVAGPVKPTVRTVGHRLFEPWEASLKTTKTKNIGIYNELGALVASLEVHQCSSEETQQRRMHEARIMAAGPELLAALQELRYACTDKAEAMADAAIARAVGAP